MSSEIRKFKFIIKKIGKTNFHKKPPHIIRMKVTLHKLSFDRGLSMRPPKIPLIPATLPLKNKKRLEAKPIINPPIRGSLI